MATSSKPRLIKCPACKKTIDEPLRLLPTIEASNLNGCPHCGVAFIIIPSEDNILTSETANNNQSLSAGESIKEVFSELDKLRGYRPPKRRAEAASIIRMLKIYTPAQIITAWETLKQDKFWQSKELFMMTVESQIGALLKNGTHKQNPRPIKNPEEYTHPDALRH